MPIIDVIVRSRTASHVGKSYYVCGNGDFVVRFDFDAEWDTYPTKTARFVDERGAYTDVVFSGSDCPMPVMSRTNMIKVGAFAGDLQTTTPARILAAKSILCDGGVPADPTPDVYTQIMELLNKIAENGVTDEQVREAIEKYLQENPIGGVTPEEVQEAVNAALQVAKDSGMFDGEDGKPGIMWRGEWDEEENYRQGDAVSFGGSAYILASRSVPDGLSPDDDPESWQLLAKAGAPGEKGDPGKTPVRGVDYWTEADKEQIVGEVLKEVEPGGTVEVDATLTKEGMAADAAAVGERVKELSEDVADLKGGGVGEIVTTQLVPIFANSIEECTDTSKVYVMPDGYIYAYIAGELQVVNLLDSAVGYAGAPFGNGGYLDGYYLSGTANASENNSFMSADASHFVTGFMPYKMGRNSSGAPIYVYGVTLDLENLNSHTRIAYTDVYDTTNADKVHFKAVNLDSCLSASPAQIEIVKLDDSLYKITPTKYFMNTNYAIDAIEYIRFSFPGSGDGVMITLEDPRNASTGKAEWKSTGHAFVSADYNGRISAIEEVLTGGEMAVYGMVDNNNTIMLYGPIAQGVYSLKYQNYDGSTTDIGNLTIS